MSFISLNLSLEWKKVCRWLNSPPFECHYMSVLFCLHLTGSTKTVWRAENCQRPPQRRNYCRTHWPTFTASIKDVLDSHKNFGLVCFCTQINFGMVNFHISASWQTLEMAWICIWVHSGRCACARVRFTTAVSNHLKKWSLSWQLSPVRVSFVLLQIPLCVPSIVSTTLKPKGVNQQNLFLNATFFSFFFFKAFCFWKL